MKRKTIYEIADSATQLGVTLPINAIVQNIATKEVFSLNEKALSTDTLDVLSKTSFGGNAIVYPIIYANSDAASGGNGTYDKPFSTLADLVSTVEPLYGTANAALLSGSYTLTLSTTGIDLKKGDKIVSSYLPYNTYVVDFNATTITVSNAATSTGTYSIFFIREYNVKAFGTFNIDASIEKDGLFWDFSGATCIIGNATAFSITSAKNSDFVVKGGKWLGIHANSKLIESSYNNSLNLSIHLNRIKAKSINTGYFIDLHNVGGGVMIAKNLNIENSEIDCINGYAIRTEAVNNYYYDSYIYGLLGGVNYADAELMYANSYMSGYIGSHQDNYALICRSIRALIYSTIDGKLNIQGTYICSVFGEMKGNTLYIGKNQDSGHKVYSHLVNQSLTIYVAGNAFIESAQLCTINHTYGVLNMNMFSGNYNGSNDSIFYVKNKWRVDFSFNITLAGNAKTYILGDCKANASNNFISLSGSSKLIIEDSGEMTPFITVADSSEVVNNGKLIQNNNYGYLINQNGGKVINNSTIISLNTNTSYPAIQKSGGTFISQGISSIKTANGKSAFKITADTAEAKEIKINGLRVNNELFADDYGTGYTPTALEDLTNYKIVTYL